MHLEQEHAQYNGARSGVEMRHLFISLVEHSLCYSDFVYARKMQSIKESVEPALLYNLQSPATAIQVSLPQKRRKR